MNNTPRKTGITRRQLNHAQVFALCTWYKEHSERLILMSDPSAAEEASKALSMDVTDGNIMGARRILGLKKPTKDEPAFKSDLAALEALLHEQNGQIKDLQLTVEALDKRVKALEAGANIA